jgi:hypothetical protein
MLVMALSCLVVGKAFAQRDDPTSFLTGNKLLEACLSGELVNQGICLGYVQGVADAFNKVACLPEGVTARQISDTLVRFLREHPELRHYSASSLAKAALTENFPCN